jgi:peptide/nickel transport system ATP-binding protein
LLQVKDLHVNYGQEIILNGIDLSLDKGQSIAIIGESGTGKTTLALSIIGLAEANVSGQILLDDTNLLKLTEADMQQIRWKKVAIAFQNANNVLNPVLSVIEQVMEPVIAHGTRGAKEAKDRAIELLELFGLPEHSFAAYPHQLSGGEQQRVLIAMALVNSPEVLILDEPLSSVDAISRIELVEKINDIGRDCIKLIVTHDLDTAGRLAQKIAVLYGGKIIEMGNSEDVLSHPRHPYTRALIRSYPNMTTLKDIQGIKGRMTRRVPGCPFHPRCTQSLEICRNRPPQPVVTDGRLIACHRGGIITRLEMVNISKHFGNHKVLNSINLQILAGETVALVGESGSGKTTLAKTIMGLYQPDGGSVRYENGEIKDRDRDYFKCVQMILQNPGESLSHRLTVLESVKEPLDVQQIGNKEERNRKALKVIEEVELPVSEDFYDKYPHHLSGGEMQRVSIARSLILDPDLLIADEPTAFLDASVQAKILKLLLNIQDHRGLSILYITHDIAAACKVSDRIAVIHQGIIVEENTTGKIVRNPVHPYTQKLLKAASTLNKQDDTGFKSNFMTQEIIYGTKAGNV